MEKKRRCILCDYRPVQAGSPYCIQCLGIIDAERRRQAPREAAYYLTYKGMVIGLFPVNGDGERLRPEPVKQVPVGFPKSKIINLDTYCPGYTRQQIKRFKATILKMAGY